jgi:hypothetical protein
MRIGIIINPNIWIVQGGEGLIRQFANQVFCSVDFKGVEH